MLLIVKEFKMQRQKTSLFILIALALTGCAQTSSAPEAAQRYRCELGIEFSARFSGDSVALDTSRGYELLFRDGKPNEYRNPRMSAEFKLGKDGREALLRYPLLPLAARCVLDR
jgi:hypothetical protein